MLRLDIFRSFKMCDDGIVRGGEEDAHFNAEGDARGEGAGFAEGSRMVWK
jgi:hypothetical protein